MYQAADANLVGSRRGCDEKAEELAVGLLLICACIYMYAVLFVTVFIYLAATPQAAGIWLMIIGACAEPPPPPLSLSP